MSYLQESLGEWLEPLSPVFSKPAMIKLGEMLATEQAMLAPPLKDIFNAFRLCPPSKTQVVIIGQDPYPEPGVAHGLSFSTAKGKTPMSLRIIFNELRESGWERTNPNLTDWAEQGVLLLNSVLTTRQKETFAHRKKGWEVFTAYVLGELAKLPQNIAIMAWGAAAQELTTQYVPPADNRLLLYACHPMAQQYSGGRTKFVGCRHFVKANDFITTPINWGNPT